MPEVTIFPLKTTLTAAITTTARPITFTVAATNALLGSAGAVFSCLIYDVGTDTNPVNAEAVQVTAGGNTLSWTGVTETGSTSLTHANGSTVVATVLTPRSIAQPLLDHVTQATIPDPHTNYLRKASYQSKGDLLPGTGLGTFSRLPPGVDGSLLIADSTVPLGVRWSGGSANTQQLGSAILSASASLSAGVTGTALVAMATIVTQTAGVAGAATTQIATQIADGLTTFRFGGIGTYKYLRISGIARSTFNGLSDTLLLQLNDDSNNTYNTQSLKVIGTTVTASQIDAPATAMSLSDIPGISALSAVPMTIIVDIPNPSSQTFAKGILARSETITTGSNSINLELLFRNGLWKPNQSVPIYSITLSLASGAFAIGSTFSLWGQN